MPNQGTLKNTKEKEEKKHIQKHRKPKNLKGEREY